MVPSTDGNTNFFDIDSGVFQRDTLELYMLIISLDYYYVLRMPEDLI